MGQDRVEQAIGRIEDALARIEGAAMRAPAPAAGDEGLHEAHQAMRSRVEEALTQIDLLLARAGNG